MKHIELGCKLMDEKYKHILEFGVYKGRTINLIRNYFSKDYKVFGFDSFEGLPEDWVDLNKNIAGDGVCVKGFFSTNNEIPDIKDVKFYKGWFENTIHEYLKEVEDIGLLHVDCDLYSSTKTVLYNLNDYIKPNTIIVFDEWVYYSGGNDRNDDHEQKCFYEWVKDFNREYELINHYDGTSSNEQQIVKILK
jgi:hypothetical protein